MNRNIDDIISSVSHGTTEEDIPRTGSKSKLFDKETYAQKKQSERETLFAMIDDTATAIVYDDVSFKNYLDVVSRFDKYSVVNTLLIFAQKPTATKLADAEHWKNENVYVKKGQKAISILGPGEKYTGTDGTEKTGYKVRKLFDIAQTTAPKASENPLQYDSKLVLTAMIKDPPVPINLSENMREGVNAAYEHRNKIIHVRPGLDGNTAIRCVSKELAQAFLAKDIPQDAEYNRMIQSTYSHCISYILCKRTGVDTSNFNFKPVIASLKNMNGEQIRGVLDHMRDITNDMWSHMRETLNHPAKTTNPNKTAEMR